MPGYPSAILVFALTHSRRNVVPTLAVAYLFLVRSMDATRVMTGLFLIGIVAPAVSRPIGETDAAFVARTISASPMSKGSRVQAHLTDCTLIIDQTIPGEKKQTVLPLMRLDEHSFEVVQDSEWGWFVEVHTQQRKRLIKTGTAKWSDSVSVSPIHVYDEKNAEKVHDALVRIVRSCRQTEHGPNQALERTADRRENLLSMTSTLKPEAQHAVVSGRSAPSR